jgi:hypothetical protein
MLRSQRILVVVGLAAIAWILHVSLCDWVYNEPMNLWTGSTYTQFPLLVYRKDPSPVLSTLGPTPSAPTGLAVVYTGLLSDPWVSKESAIVWGIAAPLFLLGSAAYLALGWRHADRAARGLCVHCGYDRRQTPLGAPCPECGKPSLVK